MASKWAILTAGLLLASCQPQTERPLAVAAPVAPAPESDWVSYGLTGSEQRYSPLDEIDRASVGRLGLAWEYEFDTDRGQESTPLIVDGKIFASTAWSKVFALDARTGAKLWSYDPEVPASFLPKACCDAVNRGVGYWQGKVFVATLDGRLIALDAATGKLLWSTLTVDPTKPYSSTGAVRVFKGKVLIGNAGAELGVRGYISAYDADSGKLAWRFYTVPNAQGLPDGAASDKVLAEKANGTWFGDGWKKTGGGGTAWDAMAYDPEADLLYIGIGNGSPHNHRIRSDGKGDNLFLSSILALRPDTGEYVWHYQVNPGDSWDYTATQPIMLADLTIDGRPRKVLMQAPKNGFFYVLDRLTGQLLSAKPITEVNWATGIDLKTGRPNEVPGARYIHSTWLLKPGSMGAHSWHPMAYSPQTGLVYIPAQEMAQDFIDTNDYRFRAGHWNLGYDLKKFALPDTAEGVAAMKRALKGRLLAWDPVTQTARWTVDHPTFLNGGVLATAGGLVFQGTAEGALVGYDAATGKQLWSYPTVNGIVAPPVSYRLDGRQYVAVMVGYGGAGGMFGTVVPDRPRLPGRLMVFALDGKALSKPYDIPEAGPAVTNAVSKGDPVAGRALYNSTCGMCHGISAGSRWTDDLRRSPLLLDRDAWESVVLHGALKDAGMVGFADILSRGDAEDLRAYIISRANRLATEK